MNLQSGNAPGVDFAFFNFDVIAVIRQALAETAETHAPRTGHLQRVLEFRAKTDHRRAARPSVAASAALIAVAAQEIRLLGFYVSEARNVNAVGAIAERHFVFVAGHSSARAGAHVVVHEVVAELAAAVGEAVGKFRRRGIEKNARGLESGGANKKDARFEFERVFGLRIDHANAGDAARRGIKNQAVNHAVRPDGKFAGFYRRRQSRTQAAEIGPGDAATMTDAAIVAGGASFVYARENGGAADGHHAVVEMFGHRRANIQLDARHFHRREKFSVRQLRQPFRLAADSGKLFDVVVPGRDVRIADRPVNGDAFFQVGFKIEIAPAIALAAPGEGFSADLPAANPRKVFAFFAGIRIVDVAHEKFIGVLIAGVVALALNGLRAHALDVIIPAAVLQLPNGNVLDVVAFRNDGTTRFQD